MFKIITAKKYKSLEALSKGNTIAEMYQYARDNDFQSFNMSWWKDELIFDCKYKGVRLKISSLEEMKRLKALKDEFDGISTIEIN